MPSIVELEVKNMSKEYKKYLYNLLKGHPDIKSELELSQYWEKTGNLEALDNALTLYFMRHYREYKAFLRMYKNSLYNQYGENWWYSKPWLLSRYIKFRSTSTYIKFKKLSSSRGWKIFWDVFSIITLPITIPFLIIAFILKDIIAPLIAGLLAWLGKWILIFLVAGGIMAGIAHLLMYIF
ncbi:hypothetical protein [Mesomycoplasma ovipneumoniae]|uniref:hypothetical protein n=1 Tax=Mesomycoplasma ovipneumoniae TaxID=29562 RepID=UPI0005C74020|nr:hypothetical protein [Mesomycoplasma ovipneumoniae]